MKYLSIILLAVMPLCSLQGQDVISKMATGTCGCLEKAKVAEKPTDKLEMELGMCLLEQVGIHDKALRKEGYDPSSTGFYEKMGETVGLQLAISCPYFMNIVMEMLNDEESGLREKVENKLISDNTTEASQATKVVLSLNGVVQTVEYGDFVKISIKDEEGKRKEFYWINSFEGDDKVMALASPDLLVGKSIKVDFLEEEAYFHKLKSYLGIKKITALVIK